jgi:hypothetical protein
VSYTFSDVKPPDEPLTSRQRWHAVAIVASGSACAAARGCKGERYLSVDAPRLPLPGCDAAVCDCTYRHFADRRQEARRADGAPEDTQANSERRRGRGRRTSDR